MSRARFPWPTILLSLLGLALAASAVDLGLRAWFELQGTLKDDALIFRAVGQGILNGLTPYRDLFETKPPGIFLLSAASLWLSGGMLPAKAAMVLALLGIPACAGVAAVRATGTLSGPRLTGALLALLSFGALLALFTAQESGELQVEPFGAVFGCLYVACVAGWEEPSRRRMLLAGLSLWAAAFFKEPFVLSCAAAAWVLSPSLSALRRTFLEPLLVAGAVQVLVLLPLGYLVPYVGVYLNHMFGLHIHQSDVPLLVRGLFVHRTLQHLWNFSMVAAFAGPLLWLGSLLLRRRAEGGGVVLVLGWIASGYAVLLAIGSGADFYDQHFVFAVPFAFALGLVLLRSWVALGEADPWAGRVAVGVTVLLAAMAALHARPDYGAMRAEWTAREAELTEAAAAVDGALDRCGLERYLHLVNRGGGAVGFTRHSPQGPVFVQYTRFLSGAPHYIEGVLDAINHGRLILLKDAEHTGLTAEALAYVRRHYAEAPWPCAQPFTQPSTYRVLFRIEGPGTTSSGATAG